MGRAARPRESAMRLLLLAALALSLPPPTDSTCGYTLRLPAGGGVEGQRLHPADVHGPQPGAHLPGRAGGERHRQHLTGGDVTLGDQVPDAVGDGAGLAGARPGQHAQRPARGLHGLTLLVV